MKKIIAVMLAFIITIACVIPISVCAEGPSFELRCSESVRIGKQVKITAVASATESGEISGTLLYDSSLLSPANIMRSQFSEQNFELKTDNNAGSITFSIKALNPETVVNGETELFTAIFVQTSIVNAGTKFMFNTSDIVFGTGENRTIAENSSLTVSVQPISTDSTLKELAIANATVTPVFSPSVIKYYVTVPYETEELNITAVPNNEFAEIKIDNKKLEVGSNNKVVITIISEAGTYKFYYLYITRNSNGAQTKSSNALLSELSVTGYKLTPEFNSRTTNYSLTVPSSVGKITVVPKAADTKAVVAVIGASTLKENGISTVTVNCTAEDGSVKKYYISVTRQNTTGTVVLSGTVEIVGTPNPGTVLSSNINGIQSGATITYTWIVDGKSAGTGISYRVLESDAGKTVKLVVNGTGEYTGKIESAILTVPVITESSEESASEDQSNDRNNSSDSQNSEVTSGENFEATESAEESKDCDASQTDNSDASKNEEASEIPSENSDNGNDKTETSKNGYSLTVVIVVALITLAVGFLCGYLLKKFLFDRDYYVID